MSEIVIRPNELSGPKVTIKLEVTGGSGSAPSWNDLKDKPFGDVEVEILPETEVVFEYNEDVGAQIGIITLTNVPESGAQCTVVYNGETYICTVNADNMLGNLGAIGGGEDTGEPFVISAGDTAASQFIFPLTEITSATVRITSEGVKTIPEEYIPDDTFFIDLGFYTVSDIDPESVDVSDVVTFEQLSDAIKRNKRIKVRCIPDVRPNALATVTPNSIPTALYITNVHVDESTIYMEAAFWGDFFRFVFANQDSGFIMRAQKFNT